MEIRITEDREECRRLWSLKKEECFFDLWAVREAFDLSFRRRPCFIVAEEKGNVAGLLPLSWIEEKSCYGWFPGETWRGKTWLEQNRVLARDPEMVRLLLSAVPDAAHLRYLSPEPWHQTEAVVEDEIGYLFFPNRYGCDNECYRQEFSGKSRKQLARELSGLETRGVSIRHDHFPDADLMFRLNLDSFGDYSYFQDKRFLASFETLVGRLQESGMLRITTILLGGKIAAIDVAAEWRNTYTVLAGGTDPAFTGVAKMINFHHLEYACARRFDSVDFLCGDFGWKQRFHLTPRPLYEIHLPAPDTSACSVALPKAAHA